MVYMIVVLFAILCNERLRLALNWSEQKETPHFHWIAPTSIHKKSFLAVILKKRGANR